MKTQEDKTTVLRRLETLATIIDTKAWQALGIRLDFDEYIEKDLDGMPSCACLKGLYDIVTGAETRYGEQIEGHFGINNQQELILFGCHSSLKERRQLVGELIEKARVTA